MAYDPIPLVAGAGTVVWSAKVTSDSQPRIQIDADGTVSWGSGSGAVDVSLSRGAANQLDLASGDSLHILGGHLRLAGTTAQPYLEMDDGQTAGLSAVGEGRLRYNNATVQFEASVNGGAYAALGGGGGNTLDQAYDQGGAGAGRKIIASDGAVLITLDDGSLPTISLNTALVVANSSAASDPAIMSLISGANGLCQINFGDTGAESRGLISYSNLATERFEFSTAGGFQCLLLSLPEVVVNGQNRDMDFRVAGDTLSHLFFTDASTATENIALFAAAAPSWQSMVRGLYWGTATTVPTAAPSGGAFIWVNPGGTLEARDEANQVGELAVPELREWWWQVNAESTTPEAVGMGAPTASGTATANDHATGAFVEYATAGAATNGGWTGAVNASRREWGSVYSTKIRTGGTITTVRYWMGFSDVDPMGAADPASAHMAAFRYDTGADGTAFWRCVTKDGTTINVTTTTTAIAVDTTYNLRIDMRESGSVKFYIDGVLVATHTTNLPGAATDMDVYCQIQNISGAANELNINKVHVQTK